MEKYGKIKEKIKKWYTIGIYCDIETGEIINKKEFKENYYKVENNKTFEIHKNYGIIKNTIAGRKTNQLRIIGI